MTGVTINYQGKKNLGSSSSSSSVPRVTMTVTLLHLHGPSLYSSPAPLSTVIEVLTQCLAKDVRLLLSSYSSSSSGQKEEEGEDMEVGEEAEGAEETAYREVQEVIRAQYTALEVLMNLGCLEDEDDWEDEEDQSTLSEDEEGDVTEEEEMEGRGEVNTVFVEAVVGRGMVARVLEMAGDLPETVRVSLPKVPGGKALLAQFLDLRVRAFLCLANLTDLLSLGDLGGVQTLHHTWTSLGALCFTDQPVEDALLEATSSAMRATTERLCGEGGEGAQDTVLRLSGTDLQSILALYSRATQSPSVRTNLVHIVGEVACMSALTPGDSASQEVDIQNI